MSTSTGDVVTTSNTATATDLRHSDSGDEPSPASKLEKKYARLLSTTARLLQRTARRQKSNRDLERTVKYLRALYNQHAAPPSGETSSDLLMGIPEAEGEAQADEEVQRLMNKKVFMVEEDREYHTRKRQRRDQEVGKAKMDLWVKWQKQRARLEMVEAAMASKLAEQKPNAVV